ncbi:MAG: aldo/keto reductase [Dokdonella sp.]
MIDRRTFLADVVTLSAAALLPLGNAWSRSDNDGPMHLLQRAIPGTDEMLPVIGLGTADSFDVGASASERLAVREVLSRFLMAGARVIDTAPSYGTAESVIGDLLVNLQMRPRAFLVTKLGANGRVAGEAQFQRSLQRLRSDSVDALLIHNLIDWKTQLAYARELKEVGKTRYVGFSHYQPRAHAEMTRLMQSEKPDFIQINYSVASPQAASRVLPLAQDLGIAVMINRTFEDGRLFDRVRNMPLPSWAAERGIGSWAQMFLKFAISNPAVTVVLPATSKPDRETDNLRAGVGELLGPEQIRGLIKQFS